MKYLESFEDLKDEAEEQYAPNWQAGHTNPSALVPEDESVSATRTADETRADNEVTCDTAFGMGMMNVKLKTQIQTSLSFNHICPVILRGMEVCPQPLLALISSLPCWLPMP
jgi:hypothetical protein